jgi:hypothetical protein
MSACVVDDQIGQFGQCPAGTKVSGVDPSTSDVLCSPDKDTVLEAGMGLAINGNVVSADMTEVAARLPVAPGYRYGLAIRSVDENTIEVAPGIARDHRNRGNLLVRTALQASIDDNATTDIGVVTDGWYWIWVLGDSDETNPSQIFISQFRTTAPNANGRLDRARLIGALRITDGAVVPFRQIGQYKFRVVHSPMVLYGADDVADLSVSDFADATPPGTTQATIAARLPTDKQMMFGNPTHPGLRYSGGTTTLASGVPTEDGSLSVTMSTPILVAENDDAFLAVTGYEWGSQEDFTGVQ